MAQNIYDSSSFFAEYNKLPRSQVGLVGAPEWPNLRDMVGSVNNARVLDLGCGYGWFCRWARENGASSVHGIDISLKMLDKAQGDWPGDQATTYEQGDLDHVDLPLGMYDIVYSSLAIHYITNAKRLFQKIYDSIVPGGRFVFSIEHPIFTAPLKPRFETNADGQTSWHLNSYQYEGERLRIWLGENVRKQHRTLTFYIEALLEPGFRLTAFKEWKPSEDDLREHPDWAGEMHRPSFLLIAAQKQR